MFTQAECDQLRAAKHSIAEQLKEREYKTEQISISFLFD